MPKLAVAIVGAGLMGRWHARYSSRAGGRVVAVVDPHPAAADALRRRHSGAAAFADLSDCLRSCAADVVHVCTATATHGQLAETALRAGKHALVEKPLASSVGEAERLLELAHRERRLLAAVHQFPFQTGFARLRRRLPELGEMVRVTYTVNSAGGDGCSADRRSQILVEMLPHAVSLFHALFGEAVSGCRWSRVCFTPDELELCGTLNGTALQVQVSLRGRPTRNELTILGTRGTAHANLFHGYAVVEPGRVSRLSKITAPFLHGGLTLGSAAGNLLRRAWNREPAYPGLHELIARFYESVRQGLPSPVSGAEILTAARLADEVVASPA